MKKGQMFIITMVFLVGLVFVIQQGFMNWFSYSIDYSSRMQMSDYYLFENMKSMARTSLMAASSCSEARDNLNELSTFLNTNVIKGYDLDFTYRINCAYWGNTPPNPAPLNLTIHIRGEDTDTYQNLFLYRF